jgi:eukaryotic-like serine/threonine-protein kinase
MDEDLIELLEKLKTAVMGIATGDDSTLSNEEYGQVRKAVLHHPDLGPLCPEWLRRGANLWEANRLVRDAAGEAPGKWQRRRELVADGINPLVDALQSSAEALQALIPGDRIGQGGFGEVYRYRHKLLDIDFAVKFLNAPFATPRDHALARFFREARILFRLNHFNIVRVHDVGLLQGRSFIKMEYVDGHNLHGVLSDRGILAVTEARSVISGVAAALHHAHEAGVIHRDLKPSNVMQDPSGRVVVLDFGLGVFVEDELVSRLTRSGEAPAGGIYSAPELLADPRLLDPLTDIYSLGAVWFYLITGLPPAGADVPALLRKAGIGEPDAPLVLRCLADRADRPSAERLIRQVAAL